MDFGLLMTAMITPYAADGSVDYAKAQKLASHLYENGTDTIVVCGTTGECPTLDEEEKIKLLQAVVEVARGRGKVIYGTTGNNTKHSIKVATDAEKYGADGVLAVVPYYNKPPQAGMKMHFKAIAESTTLPIILYNIPGRTGVNIQNATVKELVDECPNIVALKDSTGNFDQLNDLSILMGKNFIYSGDDSATLKTLALGGKGVISVASHIVGNEIKAMIEAFNSGDVDKARELHQYLTPAFKDLFICSNPIPVKECMNQLGWDLGDCRLPLCPPTDEQKEIMSSLLNRYNLI